MSEERLLTPREKRFLEEHPDAERQAEDTSTLVGVSGFLAFLVAVLLVLGPLLSVGLTFSDHSSAERLYPDLVGTAAWAHLVKLDWFMAGLSAALSIIAGLLLLKRFQRSTIYFVIILIWLSSVGVALFGIQLASTIFDGEISSGAAGAALGRPIISSLFWTTYLLLSKRVKNTYPKR